MAVFDLYKRYNPKWQIQYRRESADEFANVICKKDWNTNLKMYDIGKRY